MLGLVEDEEEDIGGFGRPWPLSLELMGISSPLALFSMEAEADLEAKTVAEAAVRVPKSPPLLRLPCCFEEEEEEEEGNKDDDDDDESIVSNRLHRDLFRCPH